MVRIWVKERLYWGRKKSSVWNPAYHKKCYAGWTSSFFSLSCKHFLYFFFFKLFDFWTGWTTRNTHILLRSVFSSVLQSCFVFFALKNHFAYLVGRNLKNFQKHLAMKMMKVSCNYKNNTLIIFFTNSLISRYKERL